MSPQQRVYCYRCRRQLTPKAFNMESWKGLDFQICLYCVSDLEGMGIVITAANAVENEALIQALLMEREGGEREVDTPAGYVDLLTDEFIIEVKHVKNWKDGAKVLFFVPYFGDRKPRIHLFGGYHPDSRQFIEQACERLGIVVTWERDPY